MKSSCSHFRRRTRSRRAIRTPHDLNRFTGFARGLLDTTFGTNGKTTTDFAGGYDEGHALALQSDDKIVVAGAADNSSWSSDFAIARYDTDGTLDSGFGTSGKVTVDFAGGNDVGRAMAIRPDGSIVVAGYATQSGGKTDFALLQLAGGSATPSLDQRLYVLQDANQNVTALVDTNGAVLQRYAEDSYGNQTVLTSAWAGTTDAYGFLYGHQGGRFDPATGLYHFRARDYSPKLGRWVQTDAAGYVDGANRYQYEGSGPIGRLDPSGLATMGGIKFGPRGNIRLGVDPHLNDKNWIQQRSMTMGNGVGMLEGSASLNSQNWSHGWWEAFKALVGVADPRVQAAFDQANWDRTNGTLDALTFGNADLGTITGTHHTFDPNDRANAHCLAGCIANATANVVNFTPVAVNLFEEGPLLNFDWTQLPSGFFSGLGLSVDWYAMRKYGSGHQWVPIPGEIPSGGPNGFALEKYINRYKGLRDFGNMAKKAGGLANMAAYLNALKDCVKKCECA